MTFHDPGQEETRTPSTGSEHGRCLKAPAQLCSSDDWRYKLAAGWVQSWHCQQPAMTAKKLKSGTKIGDICIHVSFPRRNSVFRAC